MVGSCAALQNTIISSVQSGKNGERRWRGEHTALALHFNWNSINPLKTAGKVGGGGDKAWQIGGFTLRYQPVIGPNPDRPPHLVSTVKCNRSKVMNLNLHNYR